MRSNDAKITGAVGNTVANDTVFKDNNVCLYQIASQVLTCVFVQTVPEFAGTKTYLINLKHLVERTFFGVFGTCHQDTTPEKVLGVFGRVCPSCPFRTKVSLSR